MNVNDLTIKTDTIRNILSTIKKIQKRMLDDDLVNKEYVYVYNKLCNEFSDFSDKYTKIFMDVVQGNDLRTISETLYFKDKVLTGEMTESDISDIITNRFLPKHLINS